MNGEKAEEHAIFRLKDEHVEPGHEELVKLTLSTGFTYQSPPQKPPLPPPESPHHLSLLQLFPPPSSSSTRSPEPPSESPLPHPSFSQLMSQFSSQSPEPPRFLALPSSQPQWRQTSIFNQKPPASTLHPSLLMLSFSSLPPPPGFHFSMPSSSSRQPPKENGLTLRPPELHCTTTPSSQPMLSEQMAAPQPPVDQSQEGQAHRLSGHRRKRNHKKEGWQPTIEPPYPWASSSRAKVLSMEELISKKITVITGEVKCKECKKKFKIEYDLKSKFSEVVSFIARAKGEMHDRAPDAWKKPEELDCKFCGKSKCVEPVPPKKKKTTNWLFLFLGQMIGTLKLTHLKYFCEHTRCHRTAAKDRLVYQTYKNLLCQLDPSAEYLYNPKEEDDL